MSSGELAAAWENLNTPMLGSLQHGIDYVPETGPYMLHQGEQVTPAGGVNEFNLSISVDGSKSPYATGVAVRQEVEGFLSSNRGRKMVQETSRGR